MTGIREAVEKAAWIILVQGEEGLKSAQETGKGEGQLLQEAFPDLPGLAWVLLFCAPIVPVLFIA